LGVFVRLVPLFFLVVTSNLTWPCFGASQTINRTVYPGIDLVFHLNHNQLEYDFRIAPGADPRQIELKLDGAGQPTIDANGDLVFRAGAMEIRHTKPIAYQLHNGHRSEVGARFQIDAAGHVHFELDAYNSALELVIDPTVVFTNQFGDPGSAVAAMALDAHGNIVVAGRRSFTIGGTSGDIFVDKWDPSGMQLLLSTSFGGTDGTDVVSGVAVDSNGGIYVTGSTGQQSFTVTPNAFQTKLIGNRNAFVTKLAADSMQIAYSSFLGSGSEQPGGIAVDSSGAAYVTGSTNMNFPVTANAFQKSPGDGCTAPPGFFGYPASGDAFVAKISPDGASLEYASYLGGGCGEYGNAITVNPDGSAWVAGSTFSANFPVTPDAVQPTYAGGYGDAYLARISASGDELEYATFLGGKFLDQINAIALDSSGNLYLTGISGGFTQPTSNGAYQTQSIGYCVTFSLGPVQDYNFGSAFVMKLNPSATQMDGLTYLGTACYTSGMAIAVDSADAPWIIGNGGFLIPTAIPLGIQSGYGFISQFSPDLTQLLFSTSFEPVDGLAIVSNGDAYVAGGSTTGPDSQAFVAEIHVAPETVSLDNVLSASPFELNFAGGTEGVAPGKVIRIVGRNIGPAQMTPGLIHNGVLSTTVAGVEMTFDGVAAPLLYVSSTEIGCVVPFAISGHTVTNMQVTYNGVASNSVPIPLESLGMTPEVLGVYNEDFTPNSAANPAKAGSYVILYITGGGQTIPASTDGEVYTELPPLAANTIMIQGEKGPLRVTFAGGAPGLADGIMQVNFQAPPAQSSGTGQGATLSTGVGSANFGFYVQ
jgi:uncharacterized protein (TIGR03437 family)